MDYKQLYTAYTGQWGPALWVCICHIKGSGASSVGLYMPYTGQWGQLCGSVYAIYRAVGPALWVCICHIQGSGASSVGLYMPYTGQYEKEIFSLSLGPAAA